MLNSSDLWSLNGLMLIIALCFSCVEKKPIEKNEDVQIDTITKIKVDTIQTISEAKIELTKEYCLKFYGFNACKMDSPKMIVIHHTVIPTLEQTISLFQNDSLSSNRKYINQFSSLNVGIHYVIDQNGDIYNLLPDTIIARHIIGFNHVSIGIENVAASKEDLTEAQLSSNTELINALKLKHPSLQYLIGHHENNDVSLPHYELFKSLDESYKPYDKPDPGGLFMANLRYKLLQKYNLEFLD